MMNMWTTLEHGKLPTAIVTVIITFTDKTETAHGHIKWVRVQFVHMTIAVNLSTIHRLVIGVSIRSLSGSSSLDRLNIKEGTYMKLILMCLISLVGVIVYFICNHFKEVDDYSLNVGLWIGSIMASINTVIALNWNE
jgi:hypothetical protein